jgi:hypothetical protein
MAVEWEAVSGTTTWSYSLLVSGARYAVVIPSMLGKVLGDQEVRA